MVYDAAAHGWAEAGYDIAFLVKWARVIKDSGARPE